MKNVFNNLNKNNKMNRVNVKVYGTLIRYTIPEEKVSMYERGDKKMYTPGGIVHTCIGTLRVEEMMLDEKDGRVKTILCSVYNEK